MLLCISLVAVHAQSDAEDYLVAHYEFDGNIEDALGYYNGEFVAGTGSLTEPQFMEGHDGSPNGAILFTGDNQNCYMIRVGTFCPSCDGEAGEMTVSFWGYWNGTTNESQDIINKRTTYDAGQMMWGINQHASTNHVISVRRRGSETSDSQKGMPLQKWTHVAVTLDGTNVNFYMDGLYYETLPYTYGTSPDSPIQMGSAQNIDGSVRPQDVYNGALDDVRFYSRMLNDDEIKVLYEGVSGVDDRTSTVPALSQNYPNPFNTSTSIRYSLAKNTRVEIAVFDLLGHKVAALVDGYRNAGTHKVIWDASELSTGIYIYQLKTDDFIISKKMKLIK
jgi:hypothetical protein